MAYATAQDMVTRFGEAEMIRLTVPEGQPMDMINMVRLNLAITDASAHMDTYLRRRYLTPVNPVPQELTRACCILARDDLAHGDGRAPTEQMVNDASAVRKWLRELFSGDALLADATPAGEQSFARVRDGGRPVYGERGGLGGWPNPDDFWRV